MLTSFFGKSKPGNGLAVAVFMTVFFVLANFRKWFVEFRFPVFIEKLGVLLVYLLSLYVLNFIAKRNELTRRSAYKMVFFVVFTTSFIALLQNTQVIYANFFVLLAFRRILSLRSSKEMQKKIFDATFWITIASLFYFWSILFLTLVYLGIFLYLPRFKNWLIPPVAYMAVAVLTLTFHLAAYDQFYGFKDWYEPSLFEFTSYHSFQVLIPLSSILALMLWSLGNYLSRMEKASISSRASLNLVLQALITGILVAVLAPTKDGSELIFFFAPLSIVVSTFFEKKKEKIFKEILLIVFIFLPFLTLMLQ